MGSPLFARRAARAALTLVLVSGCPRGETDEPVGDAMATAANSGLAGLALSRASYFADWDWGEAVADPRGGWRVTNDLGYTVHVMRGWLVSYAASLVECPHEHADEPADEPESDGGALGALFGGGVARAGHPGAIDPSTTPYSTVEALAAPAETHLGEIGFALSFYCDVHWVAGAAGEGAAGLPAEVAMVGHALRLEGSWTAPGSAEAIAFSWSSAIGNGVLAELGPLVAAASDGDGFGEAIEVRVVRRLDRWFDGLDLAALAADGIGDRLMLALATVTTIEVARP